MCETRNSIFVPLQFMLGVAKHRFHVKSTNRNYFLHPPVESPPVTFGVTVQQNFWDLQTKEDCVSSVNIFSI